MGSIIEIELNIDNKIGDYYYENNVDFSSFSTNVKPIAIYFPNIYLNDYLNLISSSQKVFRKINIYILEFPFFIFFI